MAFSADKQSSTRDSMLGISPLRFSSDSMLSICLALTVVGVFRAHLHVGLILSAPLWIDFRV